MFGTKKAAAPAPAPTSAVLVRGYDMRSVKEMKAKFVSIFTGLDDETVPAILAAAEVDANQLAAFGYLPVAQSLTSSVAMMGPCLTITYVKQPKPS